MPFLRLICFVLALFGALAHAADCTLYRFGTSGKWGSWSGDKSSACAGSESAAKANWEYPGSTVVVRWEGSSCGVYLNGSRVGEMDIQVQTGPCADQCTKKASTSEIVNITAGWSRDPGPTTPAQSWVYTYKLPATGVANFCSSDGCQQSIDVNEPCSDCQAYTSQVPGTNGLYRKSVDFRAHYSGTACDPSKSDIDRDLTSANDQRDPPCPGYVGEVNGVKGCYGTADKPVRPTEPQMPNKPQDNGNPAAGPKPASGEGSGTGGTGRTPPAGAGGSAGGPAGAAAGGTGSGGTGSGTRPDGTTNKPSEGKEQQACGAPGQPKCAIDESGMPDGKSAFDGSKGDLDKADRDRTDMLSRIKDTGDKNTSWGQSFSWVQHGGCEPWDLGVLPLGVDIPIKVNICPIMPYIEWVTSFLWAITTFALTIGMVFRVTSSSGS